jgi:hypothetical protein
MKISEMSAISKAKISYLEEENVAKWRNWRKEIIISALNNGENQ